MMAPSTYKDDNIDVNNNSNNMIATTAIRADETDEYNSRSTSIMRTPNDGDDYDNNNNNNNGYPPLSTSSSSPSSSTSYLCSLCRSCCTFQHFCHCVQLVNCALVCALIFLALQEYPKIEQLQQQVELDKEEIATLSEEVREKQAGQIKNLHQQVIDEEQFNFLTLAGTFTLLTCLISMFHMSTHLHKHNQPKIQRKIIAILWMSPIYSVTSFLTLVFPSVAGWMAIIKDFYESYCIYVFLSFLISVLGEGSRDQAVDVLAKHAAHLDKPTRCLSCFYEPSPDTSDHAKANAVMTQCQIYCLQFTFIRPMTTIFSVFVLHRDQTTPEEEENFEEFENNNDGEFNDNTYDGNNTSSEFDTDEESSEIKESSSSIDSSSSSSSSNNNNNNNNDYTSNVGNRDGDRTRTLRIDNMHNSKRHIQQQQQESGYGVGGEGTESINGGNNSTVGNTADNNSNAGIDTDTTTSINSNVEFPSPSPIKGDADQPSPVAPIEGVFTTFAPSIASNLVNTLAPTIAAAIAGSLNNNTTISTTTINNITDGIIATIFPTDAPTTSSSFVVNETTTPDTTSFGSSELGEQTKAYFRSPGFAVAMVVNISIFFAFTGLLKLYHAVRDDLLWCRPWPKFLTIKAVVFLTFWQGLAILLWLVLTADPDEKEDATLQARKYQNLLICLEMLLVAICQWVSKTTVMMVLR
jgi:hypothetical protein